MKTVIYKPTQKNLRFIANELRAGNLAAIPTETVYGLAANALDTKACEKIFTAKRRPTTDPLIVHVENLRQAEQYALFNALARKLAKRFWPGPLTLVLHKKECVPDIVTAGGSTVAIRAPAHPLARILLKLTRLPLAAPSANLFGYISPTEADHVAKNMAGRVAHILDGGSCALGLESTIIDLTDPARPKILRSGSITEDMLNRALAPIKLARLRRKPKQQHRQLAPGMLSRHYSPHTPLGFLQSESKLSNEGLGVVFLRKPSGKATPGNAVYWFSERGSLTEIARNLYRILRRADSARHKKILVEMPDEANSGLAIAIRDRLTRAASKR